MLGSFPLNFLFFFHMLLPRNSVVQQAPGYQACTSPKFASHGKSQNERVNLVSEVYPALPINRFLVGIYRLVNFLFLRT